MQETWVWPPGWQDPLKKKWQPTPVFLPGKFHGQRTLVGYNLQGHKETWMKGLSTHTHTRGRRPDLLCFRPYESRPSSVSQETSHQEPNSWHINLGLPSLLIYSGPAVLRLFSLHTHPKSVFQLHFPQWCFWVHISASLGEVWLS